MKQKNKPFKVCRKTTADDRIKKAASVGFGVHTKENPKVERVEKTTEVLRPCQQKPCHLLTRGTTVSSQEGRWHANTCILQVFDQGGLTQ